MENLIIQPGLYPDMPNKEYHNHAALSSTQIVNGIHSMAKLFEVSGFNKNRRVSEQTQAQKFGSAMHCYLLEPDVFHKEYQVMPDKTHPRYDGALHTTDDLKDFLKDRGLQISGNKKKLIERIKENVKHPPIIWDDEIKKFYEKLGEREPISPEWKNKIEDMAKRLEQEVIQLEDGRRFKARDLFNVGKAEESFFYQHHKTGLWLRVRTDWRISNLGIIIDYKTTQSASKRHFGAQVEKLYYYVRAAMYQDVVKEVTGIEHPYFIFLAQETEAPYLAKAYILDEYSLQWGRAIYNDILVEAFKCQKSGVWPGYNEYVEPITLSDYAYGDYHIKN